MLLHNGNKEDYVCNPEEYLRHLLLLPCPIVKEQQQPKTGRIIEDSDSNPSGMKVWGILSGKREHSRFWRKAQEIWNG